LEAPGVKALKAQPMTVARSKTKFSQ